MRDRLAISTASLCGVVLVIQYFVSTGWMETIYSRLLSWMQIIFVFALLVGIFAVLRAHWKRARREPKERIYVFVLIGSTVAMALIGFVWGTDRHSPFQWAFDHLQAPMQATVFSLLAFYVTSAAYRGFRARSAESVVLVIGALIVLLGRVPLGEWLMPFLPDTAEWVLTVPALAAKRAILIGIGLGMAATAIKVIAGIERTYLGGR